MNRAQRREFGRRVKGMKRQAMNVPDSVTLRGGPMNGWVVKPDAPALDPDWREKYLEEEARALHHQHIREAFHLSIPTEWDELSGAQRQMYRDVARQKKGAGRYVRVDEGSLHFADWEPM